ncbi:MAG: hypothetical protein U7M05_07565, partial [Candidatus Igneacidithiobacillus chanchocoensis]
EKMLKEAGGNKGVARIGGDKLNPGILEKLSRSAASVGSKVSARILRKSDAVPTTVHLGGDPISFQVEDVENVSAEYDGFSQVFSKMRNMYRYVRDSLDL